MKGISMNQYKKAIALLLVLLLVLPAFGCGRSENATGSAAINDEASAPAVDDGNPTIIIDTVHAAPGDKSVTVTASVKNNPGILGMTLCVSYDESVLTLKSAENGEALSVLNYTAPGTLKSSSTFLWDAIELSDEDVRDGTILTMTFAVSKDAEAGTYPVILSYGEDDIFDGNLDSVYFYRIDGAVVVD